MSNWIPVSERLPAFSVKVLAYWRPVDHKKRPYHKEIIIAQRTIYLPEGGESFESPYWWANGQYYDTETFITHWMPLPEPPETENE